MKKILLLALLWAAPAAAQTPTVVGPTPTITFNVPTTYNDLVAGTTQPVVENVKIRIVRQSATGTVLQTQDLGKPVAANGAQVTVTSQVLTNLNTILQADVLITGPGGSTPSALSNPFVSAAPPGTATNVSVR